MYWTMWSIDRILILFVSVAFLVIGVQVTMFHYRQSFHNKAMWVPVISSPIFFIVGIVLTWYNASWLHTLFTVLMWFGVVAGLIASKSKGGPVWGERLRETLLNYNYYGRVTMVGEVLPHEDNRVTLTDELDSLGLPRAKVTFSYGDNDTKLIDHAVAKMSSILEAAGGKVEFVIPDTAHMMGGCRMGDDAEASVVNSYGQTHDIPNLFICDASIFVTSGAGNPTNTVMSLALRTAD